MEKDVNLHMVNMKLYEIKIKILYTNQKNVLVIIQYKFVLMVLDASLRMTLELYLIFKIYHTTKCNWLFLKNRNYMNDLTINPDYKSLGI